MSCETTEFRTARKYPPYIELGQCGPNAHLEDGVHVLPPIGAIVSIPISADVRDGTATGQGFGTLDLPDESDVAEGVEYDNATKTGTLVAGEAATGDAVASDVADGKTFSNAEDVGLTGTSTKNATVPEDAPIQPPQAFVDAMIALHQGAFFGVYENDVHTAWGDTVTLNGNELTWDAGNKWYSADGDKFVQKAYFGPFWLVEINGVSNYQQYFLPDHDEVITTFLSPVVAFNGDGSPADDPPPGGFYLNGVSGLSWGYKLGRYYPYQIPFAADGELTTYLGDFEP